jgi:UDP-N-acetylglucosamine acyltransferase
VSIHPTAVVSPGARLAEGVTVGPYSIIDEEVEVGRDSWIGAHVVIRPYTSIGERCRLFQFGSIGEIPQDLKFAGEASRLTIGDGTTIREFVTLNRGTAGGGGLTSIGAGCLLMAYVHVAHDCHVGNGVVMSNAASLAGHVIVEDRASIGGLAGVHQFVRIGTYAFVGAGSLLTKDVPPYTLSAGNPQRLYGLNVVGLKRAGFAPEVMRALKEAYRLVVREPLLLEDALRKAETEIEPLEELRRFVEFVRASQRGIPRLQEAEG